MNPRILNGKLGRLTETMTTGYPIRMEAMALAVFAVLLAPLAGRCAQIDPSQIQRIVGNGGLPKSEVKEVTPKLLDAFATIATSKLGHGDSSWNASNPKWSAVFDRVRDDLERDSPMLSSAVNSAFAAIANQYLGDVASEMQQSDVDKILSYYNSPEGRRYEAFRRSVDSMMASGLTAPVSRDKASSTANIPNPEQSAKYLRMLQLSAQFQSAQALARMNNDPSDNGVAFFAAGAIARNAAELELLCRTYSDDLAKFEDFSKAEASQHLLRAVAIAGKKILTSLSNAFQATVDTVMKKHEAEWNAFYATEAAK